MYEEVYNNYAIFYHFTLSIYTHIGLDVNWESVSSVNTGRVYSKLETKILLPY